MHKSTLSILAAYEQQSLSEIMSFRTADCTSIMRPSSISSASTPMDNTTYSAFYTSFIPKIWNVKHSVSEIIESPQANKVVVFTSITADSKEGVGSYEQEYVIVFEFDESGEKIKRMVEWVDSARVQAQAKILFG
jgi:hypothetical protein